MKVLIIDCYDSFTFNLFQQVGKLGGNPVVMTCDTPLEQLKKTQCSRIILSPGPGTPADSGVCPEVLETMSLTIPTLGVCLGHQATRYHSLVAKTDSLPPDLQVSATSLDDHYVMGVRHTRFPIEGVQFHPESILSPEGDRIIRNFLYGKPVAQ
jgi:anthranilate/para-aminobenzoate synthase component II